MITRKRYSVVVTCVLYVVLFIAATIPGFATTNSEVQDLMVADVSVLDTSLVLYWNSPDDYSEVDVYQVYVNDELFTETENLSCKVTNLTPSTEYTFKVRTVLNNSHTSDFTLITEETLDEFDYDTYNVTNSAYGASANGEIDDTRAIQSAIDDCNQAGGGVVYLPGPDSGENKKVYLSGALQIKSNVILVIDGVLKGSEDLSKYPQIESTMSGDYVSDQYAALIYGGHFSDSSQYIEDIKIIGEGKISGAGEWLGDQMKIANNNRKEVRANLISPINATNVYIEGLYLEKPTAWTVHPVRSQNIVCYGLDINTYDTDDSYHGRTGDNYHGDQTHNGDGIDPDACDGVFVLNCRIETGDDCLAIKSGKNLWGYEQGIPCQNIRITDSIFLNGHGGITVGSEMSGGVRNIFAQHNFADGEHLYSPLRFKSSKDRGGIVENVIIRDMEIDNPGDDVIRIRLDYSINSNGEPAPVSPIFRNFEFSDIQCVDEYSNKLAVNFIGIESSDIENVVIKNSTLKGKNGAKLRYCDGITFENVIIDTKQGSRIDENSTVTNFNDITTPVTTTLISNLEMQVDENWTIKSNIQQGDKQYTDRDFIFSEMPSYLVGADWISTSNNSKKRTEPILASFSLNQDVSVYIILDNRVDKPTWIDDTWVVSNDIFKNSSKNENFVIYSKEFVEGDTVVLGNNQQTSGCSMYTIIVK